MTQNHSKQTMNRRAMLGTCAALAGGAALGLLGCQGRKQAGPDAAGPGPYPLAEAGNVIHTVCLQCNTQCTLKVKIQDGLVAKIDGNPYSPMTVVPHLPYETPPAEAVAVDGAICPKGQAGVQTLYDPYRLRRVLKRNGPRGSNKWKSIPFEQAIREICDGGRLFADIGENREIAGFKDVLVLRDAKLAKDLAADAGAVRRGELTVEAFKERNADHLGLLIDPEHPDLGPRNNQFVLQGGRISPDRDVITKRFTFGAAGSVNWFGHTCICEQAHHVAFMYTLARWQEKDGKFSWAKGPNHMKPDYTQSEFVIDRKSVV